MNSPFQVSTFASGLPTSAHACRRACGPTSAARDSADRLFAAVASGAHEGLVDVLDARRQVGDDDALGLCSTASESLRSCSCATWRSVMSLNEATIAVKGTTDFIHALAPCSIISQRGCAAKRHHAEQKVATGFARAQRPNPGKVIEAHRRPIRPRGAPAANHIRFLKALQVGAEESAGLVVADLEASIDSEDHEALVEHRHHRSVLRLTFAYRILGLPALRDVGVNHHGPAGLRAKRRDRQVEPALRVRTEARVLVAELRRAVLQNGLEACGNAFGARASPACAALRHASR